MSALIISRKLNESLRIGEAVIKVIRLSGNRISLRIEAPREVKVMRTELEEVNSPIAVQSNAFVPMNHSHGGGCFLPGQIEEV